MVKKAAAKKKSRKRVAPAKATAPATRRPAVEVLVELEKRRVQFEKDHAQQYRQMLLKAIEEKTEELAKARKAREQAEAKEAKAESELANLKSELAGSSKAAPKASKAGQATARKAGKKAAPKKAARKGRKPAAKKAGSAKKTSGRKKRVDADTKRKYVAQALKSFPNGVAFSVLRDQLKKSTLEGSNSLVFGAVDLNSSSVFGKRLLPAGWVVQGSHKNAKVVKK